jgi:addiction module RelE/StbE family toxin
MEVVLSTKAQDDLDRLARSNPKIEQNVRAHLRRLPAAYRHDPTLKGVFRGYRRHRAGDYRIIYRADPEAGVLLIVRIGHRREIYDR